MFSSAVSCLTATALLFAASEASETLLHQPLDLAGRRSRPAVVIVQFDDDDKESLRCGIFRRSPIRGSGGRHENELHAPGELLPTRRASEEWRERLKQVQTSAPTAVSLHVVSAEPPERIRITTVNSYFVDPATSCLSPS